MLRESPESGNLLAQLGQAHLTLGQIEDGIELFRESMRAGWMPYAEVRSNSAFFAEGVTQDARYLALVEEIRLASNRLRALY